MRWATTLTTMPDARSGVELVEAVKNWVIDTIARPVPDGESDIREESDSSSGWAYAWIGGEREYNSTHGVRLEVRLCNVDEHTAAIRIECRFISDDGQDPKDQLPGPPKFLDALLQAFPMAGGLDARPDRPGLVFGEPRITQDSIAESERVLRKEHQIPLVIVTPQPGGSWRVDPNWLAAQLRGAAEVAGATVSLEADRRVEQVLGYRWWYDSAMVLEPRNGRPKPAGHWHHGNNWQQAGTRLGWDLVEAALNANVDDERFDSHYYRALSRVNEAGSRPVETVASPDAHWLREMERQRLRIEELEDQTVAKDTYLMDVEFKLSIAQGELKDARAEGDQLREDLKQEMEKSSGDWAKVNQERRALRQERTELRSHNSELQDRIADLEGEVKMQEGALKLANTGMTVPANQFGYLSCVHFATSIALEGFQKEVAMRLSRKGYDLQQVYTNSGIMDGGRDKHIHYAKKPECLFDYGVGSGSKVISLYAQELGDLQIPFDKVTRIRNRVAHPQSEVFDARKATSYLREIREVLQRVGLNDHAQQIAEVESNVNPAPVTR